MTSPKTRFNQLLPGKVFLENGQVSLIEKYLKDKEWIAHGDQIKKIEKAGESNMNFVRRVLTDKNFSFILKQSRPWVEKYPQVQAPVERIKVEYTYYETIGKNKILGAYSPRVLHFDAENFVMALQDLGEAADFSYVYKKDRQFTPAEVAQAISYLNTLQQTKSRETYPENKGLRLLNHQHIFHLPFVADNGFNLDDVQRGLQGLSEKAKSDTGLKARVSALGDVYLENGKTLLQGDFYPGSLLKVKDKVKIIDPEFSFFGPVEWDIAVFIAHLFMSGADRNLIRSAYGQFDKKENFKVSRFSGFVGTEILRRLIGLAQLPLEMGLMQKAQLIDRSISWVKQGKIDVLVE